MSIRVCIVAGSPQLLLAEKTLTAGNGERDDNAVAALQIINRRADLFHDAHELVPENVSLLHRWDKSVKEMKVGPADSCARDLDDRIVRIQDRRIFDIVNLHLATSHPTERFHDLLQFAR